MKRKIVLLNAFFLLLLTATSCKKTYECTCVSVYAAGGTYTSIAGAKSTKKDAQSWCSAIQGSYMQYGISTTCTLN
jgi:hypothetical protein